MNWFQKGADAAAAFHKDEQEQQQRYEQSKKAFRFWLKDNEEARITFVDGNLTDKGFLDVISFKEHRLLRNGSWNNFYVCTKDVDGSCPICEEGDAPSRVAVLTIIDHRKILGKKKADGTQNVYQNVPKLFVAKANTIKQLTSLAQKRGGLAGCTFDVMRIGSQAPAVGSQFDFIEKNPLTVLKSKYYKVEDGKKITLFRPLNYQEEITYISSKELRKLGFGTAIVAQDDEVEEELSGQEAEDAQWEVEEGSEEEIPFDPDNELPD